MSRYLIVIEGAEDGDGYSAYAPDLPGVAAAAETYDRCVALMAEAVAFHIEGLLEDGDEVPRPRAVGAETVPAA